MPKSLTTFVYSLKERPTVRTGFNEMSQAAFVTIHSTWQEYDKLSDERTRGWLLVDSPHPIALLILAYLLMVWMLPKFMERKKPFQLKGLLVVYNFILVALNAHILREISMGTTRLNLGYLCHPYTVDNHPEAIRVANATWLILITKCIELLDTLFLILRKKKDQLSVLHVFHHTSVVPLSWIGVKWFPYGPATRLAALNCFIHVIMYSYYGLSAIGPQLQKYLWWKKYLTVIQLVQFCISLAFAFHSIARCRDYPMWTYLLNIVYMCLFLILFGKFFVKKYRKQKVQ